MKKPAVTIFHTSDEITRIQNNTTKQPTPLPPPTSPLPNSMLLIFWVCMSQCSSKK